MRTGFKACEPADCFKVCASVSDCVGKFSEEDDRAMHAGARESAGEGSSVAAVVTSAAEDQGLFAG